MYPFHHVHLPLDKEVTTSIYHSPCKDLQSLFVKRLLCFVILCKYFRLKFVLCAHVGVADIFD
jgi:hypothetical protein